MLPHSLACEDIFDCIQERRIIAMDNPATDVQIDDVERASLVENESGDAVGRPMFSTLSGYVIEFGVKYLDLDKMESSCR